MTASFIKKKINVSTMFLQNNKIYNFFKLLRAKQWYKNLLVFAAIFFSTNLFNIYSVKITVLGFILLCLSSSGNYIINDIIDYKKDKLNPKKKNRPIANDNISRSTGYIIAFILYLISFIGSFILNRYFFLTLIGISTFTFFYSIYFKHEIILDITFIAINFVLRALSGIFLINVEITLWFFLEIFFFAFFLVTSKRYVDFQKLTSTQKNYKPVLKKYSKKLLETMLIIFLTALILVYGFYAYFTNYLLFFMYPFLIYILIYYYNLTLKEDFRIQDPEKFIFEKRETKLNIVAILLIIGIFIIYYGKWI